jgi:ABC-type multidrug transport system ATPase subunit
VITGGPGTGKTTLLKVLLRVIERLGLDTLCASADGTRRQAYVGGDRTRGLHHSIGSCQYQPRIHEFMRNEGNRSRGIS